jgi:hypothetical protein
MENFESNHRLNIMNFVPRFNYVNRDLIILANSFIKNDCSSSYCSNAMAAISCPSI